MRTRPTPTSWQASDPIPHPAHERFALAFVRCGVASKAYTEVYGEVKNPSAKAARLMGRSEVIGRIDHLRHQVADAAVEDQSVNRDWVLRELREAAAEARESRDRQVWVRSVELLGKSLGVFAEKLIVSRGSDSELDEMSDDQLRERLAGIAADLGPSVLRTVGAGQVIDLEPLADGQPVDGSSDTG